ncbi:MAG: sigma-70 family RNA polymerase sigma factor [Sedimentisphaerales bacterium]|nr:sigma-70 family RNA polymerase sigma factor [Sedimentisphaerales bacterium]
MLDDERLISQLHQGNKEALREIYLKYKDNLLTIATALLHDSIAAEDILHDVFITLARAAKRLELRVNLKNYLIASISNRIKDKYRKKSHNMVELENAGQITSKSGNPEQVVIFAEEVQYLINALYNLPFEQREVIILHLTGGLKFREIATMLDTSTSTIQGRYRYGIAKLKTELNGEEKNDSR